MRRRFRLVGSVAPLALAAAFACSSSKKDDDPAGLGDAGERNGQAGTIVTTGSGGNQSSNGGSIAIGGNTAPTTGGSGGGSPVSCAGEVTTAKQVPLDIYIMLDSSASMLEAVSGTEDKWGSVTDALVSFIGDPQSAGLGVGVQFFPLRDEAAPEACTTNEECGAFGPCFQKFCENAGPLIYPCDANSECFTLDGEDLGPCIPVKRCWQHWAETNESVLCHADFECEGPGDCVPFAQCEDNPMYNCPVVGSRCSDGMTEDFGDCVPFNPKSICLHDGSCQIEDYSDPAVDISVLPDAATRIAIAIRGHDPDGNTPTAPALEGAIAHASAWAESHAGHRVIVVLATDGLPTECLDDPDGTLEEAVQQVTAVASAGLAADPSITTYVIGVFAQGDTEATGNLNAIADAGGSDSAFLVADNGDVEEEFRAALDTIRGTGLVCEFQIPSPTDGNSLDYGLVNVEFTSGGTTQSLYNVQTEADCDNQTGGWYYDVVPTEGTPTKIIACPASCDAFQEATDGSVEIRLGCETIVR